MVEKVIRTDAEWRSALDPETYRVTRRKGTERAFTGKAGPQRRVFPPKE